MSVVSPGWAKKALAGYLLLVALAAYSSAATLNPSPSVSTTVRSLRTAKGDGEERHVQVRGVVTAFSGWKNSFFLQDETGGISVDRREQTPVQVGDEVEVTGTARPGLFAPIFLSDTIHVLGKGRLPKAHISTYLELTRGNLDSSRIEVMGIIHSARIAEMWGKKVLLLDLHTLDGGDLTVHVLDFGGEAPSELIDSTVVVRGVCGTVFNSRQQLVGVRIFAPSLSQIERVMAPAEPFHVPLSTLSSLLRFNPNSPLQHRVRVLGTVTLQTPGHSLYLQSEGLGIRVETNQQDTFPPGARVEAFGFVSADGYSATMDNADVRLVAKGRPPQPVRISAAQVIGTKDGFTFAPYDGVLVQMEARIIERLPRSQSQLWLVEDQHIQFQAELSQDDQSNGRVEPGSLVRLTGVCRVEVDSRHNPISFRILLRNPDDIAVVRGAYGRVSVYSATAALALLLSAIGLFIWLEGRSGRGPPSASQSSLPELVIPEERLLAFARASKVMAILAAVIGALVLIGWAAGIPLLKSIRGDYPNMKANAALCLLTAGIALWLANQRGARVQTAVSRILAVFTALVGGLTLVECLTGWNLHIDQALFSEPGLLLSTASPGRMSLVTALSFFLLGFALAVAGTRHLTMLAQALALITGALCLLSLNSYLYGIHNFEGIASYAASAVHASIGMVLLSLGILLCCPSRGLMRTIALAAPGGVMALRLLPRIMLVPSVLGWIRWQGQLQGYYDTAFGLALFTSINTVCFLFLIWTTASLLNRLDRVRLQSEAEVRNLNDTLEARVAQRTAELQASEQSFRSIIDAVKDYSIITLDAAGNVTTWNSGAERQKGYRAEEILGKHLTTFFSEEDQKRGLAYQELAIAEKTGECRQEGWRVRKDGRSFWANVLITSVRNEDGSLRGFSKITQDITEQKRAQERFRLVVEAVPNAVVMASSDGKIALVNFQTEKLFGYDRTELVGQPVEMLVPSRLRARHEGHRSAFFSAPARRAMDLGRDLIGVRKDGSEVPIEVGLNPISTRDGSFVLASIIDITERKNAEKMLELRVAELAETNKELARKSEEVEAFVYIVSHDLRGPLVNLQGFSRELEMSCDELRENLLPILSDATGSDGASSTARRVHAAAATRIEAILREEIPGSLRYISASTTKFRRLIDALLELSRYGREAHRPEELDLTAMVSSTLDLMRMSIAASGAQVSVGRMPRVQGDATAIGQVFANLIGNSLKYLQPGRPGKIEIGGEMESGMAHCWVRDNGAGLPAGAQARLFQVFQRFHPQLAQGEGMGLAIVKRIVERHGGKIWAEGEEGVGTTFHFTLSDE